MSFSSKHRRKSRRERYDRDKRNFKVTILFLLLALVVYVIMEWDDISFYVGTYFY